MNSVRPRADLRAGVYVHVPFCERLCPYCDFAVAVRRTIDHEGYRDRILAEFESRADTLQGRDVRSVYFGGGTPSLWEPQMLADVLGAIRSRYRIESSAEMTLEANPASCDVDRVAVWKAAGINRVSLGVQSFQDRYLTALGRNHDREGALEAVRLLQSSGIRVSVDLIVGGPGHLRDELEGDLAILAEYDVAHVSAYQMTVEPRTVFFRRVTAGELTMPDDDHQADLLDRVYEALSTRGISQYEVSSFGRFESRAVHNQTYWMGGEYLGLGVGAHSFSIEDGAAVRRGNSRNLKVYLDTDTFESEPTSAIDHLRERLFLGVRSAAGVQVESLRDQFSLADSTWNDVVSRLDVMVEKGLLRLDDGVYVPTRTGYMFCDTMAESLYEVT